MKIALICASPKTTESSSKILIDKVKCFMGDDHEVIELGIHADGASVEKVTQIYDCDTWVFSYPLYIDGIPGHLLKFLLMIYNEKTVGKKMVYGIVNAGFYESEQTLRSLKVLENWALKCGFEFGGGTAVGGGGGLSTVPATKMDKGPMTEINRAIKEMTEDIKSKRIAAPREAELAFPRFLYKFGAEHMWKQMAKVNGLKKKDLDRRPNL